MSNDYKHAVGTQALISRHAWNCFSAINLISFLLPQTLFLYFLIYHQLLNKWQYYAQAFAFKTIYIDFPVRTLLSHENTTETWLPSKKCRLAKLCKVDAESQRLHFTGEARFSIRFFFSISKISAKVTKLTNVIRI